MKLRNVTLIGFLLFTFGCGEGRLSPQGGTVTGTTAGNGLTGGGTGGNVTLNIGAATGGGIAVTADAIGLLTTCNSSQGLTWNGTSWGCASVPSFSAMTTNAIQKATSATTIGDSLIMSDAGSVYVTGGTGTLSTVGGVHTYFAANAGFISSTTPGTANRPLTIQGNDLILQGNGATALTISGANSTFAGLVNLTTPAATIPALRHGRAGSTFQWGYGMDHASNNWTAYAYDGSAWSAPHLAITPTGNVGMTATPTTTQRLTVAQTTLDTGIRVDDASSALTSVLSRNVVVSAAGTNAVTAANTDHAMFYGSDTFVYTNTADIAARTHNVFGSQIVVAPTMSAACSAANESSTFCPIYDVRGFDVTVTGATGAKTITTYGGVITATAPTGTYTSKGLKVTANGSGGATYGLEVSASPGTASNNSYGIITSATPTSGNAYGIQASASGGAANYAVWASGTQYSFYGSSGAIYNAGDTTLGSTGSNAHTINGSATINGTLSVIVGSGAAGAVIGTSTKHYTWYPSGTDLRLHEYATTFGSGGADRITIAAGGNVTFANNVTVNGSTALVDVQSTKGVGATFADLDAGTKANLRVRDSTAIATGVGGGILFEGVYTVAGSVIAAGAGIKAMKVNATDGDYSFDLVLGARANGSAIAEGCRLHGITKIWNCIGGLQVSRTDAAGTGRVIFERFHGANGSSAGDGGLVRFNMGNAIDTYNVEIGSINTLGSPSFLNPKFVVRTQNLDSTGTANVTERLAVTNTGAVVNGGLSPTAVAAAAGTTLTTNQVDGTANYLTIRAANVKGILFANGNAADDGKIVYDQLARGMTFGTSGVYRMSIDSAGSLVIGDSANTAGTGNFTATGNVSFGGANTNTLIVTSGISGRLRTVSAPPTLSTCGTSTAAGSNLAGRITSVGSPTACTLTFATAFAVTPACVLTPAGGVSLYLSAQSTTAITVTTVSGVALPDFNYTCFETP